MNMLYEIGLEGKGTLMMIPANTPAVGVSNPMSIVGLDEITKRAKESKGTSSQ